jgi:hypothetical protein
MKEINVELVRERAREIRESLGKIRRYTAQSDADFFADERNLYTVMHLLLTCIEATAAICNHLIAKNSPQSPGQLQRMFWGPTPTKHLRRLFAGPTHPDGSFPQYSGSPLLANRTG